MDEDPQSCNQQQPNRRQLDSLIWNRSDEQYDPAKQRKRRQEGPHLEIYTLPRCLLFPRIFISFAVISNNKLFRNSTWILLAHLCKKIFFRGTWRLMESAKWIPEVPATDSVSAWDEVISSCRITLFSDIPWKSWTWLSLGGYTCLIH